MLELCSQHQHISHAAGHRQLWVASVPQSKAHVLVRPACNVATFRVLVRPACNVATFRVLVRPAYNVATFRVLVRPACNVARLCCRAPASLLKYIYLRD